MNQRDEVECRHSPLRTRGNETNMITVDYGAFVGIHYVIIGV